MSEINLHNIDFSQLQEQQKLEQQETKDRKSDRKLKKSYAKNFFWILVVQLGLMNIIFLLYGCGLLTYDAYTLDIFVTATLLEVFGIVAIITKNLFPRK
jgi:hypothetical protein